MFSLIIAMMVAAGLALGLFFLRADNKDETLLGKLVCHARGGQIQSVCLRGLDRCVVPFPDGGKRCSSSSECSGGCFVDFQKDCGNGASCHPLGPPEVGSKVEGVCLRSTRPCGEFARVENGIVVESFVAD